MPKYRDPLLKSILSQPTAPYREGHVISLVKTVLEKGKVPYFEDPVGNLVLGVRSPAELRKLLAASPKDPLRIFMAHMDHPGFHGVKWLTPSPTEDTLEIQWHGGSPVNYVEGFPVWLGSADGWETVGEIVSAKILKTGRAIDTAVVRIPATPALRSRFANATHLFGGFGFRKPVWEEGDLIYTKAADDLVGSFAIVSLALDLFSGKKKTRKKSNVPFLGVLTRAEEVGFIGAIGHLDLGWYKKARRPLLFVSLETSRTLPGAEIGKGPVVRLGDRFTVFSAPELRVFLDLAEKLLPGKHQARVMDGGACEASAATAYGYRAIGISIPLGNYHNQCFEGGPDSGGPLGPAPEFVHKSDVEGMLTLCHGLLRPGLAWADPWKKRQEGFRKSFVKAKKLLRSGP